MSHHQPETISLSRSNFIINHAEDQWVFADPMFVPLLEALKDKLPTVRGYVVMTSADHMPETSHWTMRTAMRPLLRVSPTHSIGRNLR